MNEPNSFIIWNDEKKTTPITATEFLDTQIPNCTTKLSPLDVADYLVKNHRICKFSEQDQTLYAYNAAYGYYEKIPIPYNSFIRNNIPKEYMSLCTKRMDAEIYTWLQARAQICSFDNYNSPHINFRNGVYDAYSRKFLPHSPEYGFQYYINYDFSEKPKETPNFDYYINFICNEYDEMIQLIYELIGLIISNIRNTKYFFLLAGKSNTGKSLFINLLFEMIGHSFSTSIPLKDIASNFRISELASSRLNAFAETDCLNQKDLSIIKSLTSGDRITADVKFNHGISFYNKALLLFATNQLKGFTDLQPNDPMWNRLVLLPFSNVVETQNIDTSLKYKIIGELPDALSKYATAALTQFVQSGYRFSNPDFIEECKLVTLLNTFPVHNYLSIFLEEKEGSRLSTAEVYNHYKDYCKSINSLPVSQQLFNKYLIKHFPNTIKSKQRIAGYDNPVNCYMNIDFKDKTIEKETGVQDKPIHP